jgi:transcription antitermination factor NusG
MEKLRWYALRVKPQHESSVYSALQSKSLEGFNPTYKSRRTWTDRVKVIEQPFFAGYVFGRFAFCERVPVLRTPGVVSVVGFGNQHTPIPDEELNAVQRLTASGLAAQPWPFLKLGQTVRIERGPLRGVEGLLLADKDSWRVVVGIELLQRSVSVTLDRDSLSSISSPFLVVV